MPKAKFTVKIDFDEEEYKKLSEIKSHYGLKHDTEAIRLSVNDAYIIMKKREKILEDVAAEKEE